MLAITNGTRYLNKFSWLYTTAGGFWIANVRSGDDIRVGHEIGRVIGLAGAVIETVVADAAGVVLFVTTSAAVKAQGLLLGLGVWPTAE